MHSEGANSGGKGLGEGLPGSCHQGEEGGRLAGKWREADRRARPVSALTNRRVVMRYWEGDQAAGVAHFACVPPPLATGTSPSVDSSLRPIDGADVALLAALGQGEKRRTREHLGQARQGRRGKQRAGERVGQELQQEPEGQEGQEGQGRSKRQRKGVAPARLSAP